MEDEVDRDPLVSGSSRYFSEEDLLEVSMLADYCIHQKRLLHDNPSCMDFDLQWSPADAWQLLNTGH